MEEKKHPESAYEKSMLDKIDPSSLTTQLVLREVASLKELLLTHIERIDKAVTVAHEDLVRVPTDVQGAVGDLKELHNERFASLERRFLIMEELKNEKFSGIQKQIDMQEKLVTMQYNFLVESINKSDAAFIKSNESMGLLISINKTSTDDKINDVKDGVSEIKTIITGLLSTGTGRHEQIKSIGANIGTVISIITLIIVLIGFALRFSGKSV